MATRWGIISAGKIAHDFSTVLMDLPKDEHQIVAVAARDLNRAKEFASFHEIPTAYGSYKELAKDKNVDIVHIGVINTLHFEVAKLMLENGKHVLVEKPMCINAKQTLELIKIAKENKLFLMEGLWSRFFPVFKQLSVELSKKTIGDIVYVHVTHGILGQDAERICKKSLGGGGILDIGVYVANVLMTVFNEEPLDVKTVGSLNQDGVDLCVASSLLFSKNRTAHVTICTYAELQNQVEIVGTKGTIKIPSRPYHCPTELITPEKTNKFPLPETRFPCHYINSSGLRYEAICVRECLRKGLKECPQLTHKDSEINARIRDQWRRQIGVVFPEDEE